MQPLALRPGAQRVPPKRIQPSLLAFLRPINGPDESNKEGLNFIARDSKEEEIKKKPCVQERALKSVERSTGEKARIIVDLECPIVSEPGLKKKPAARRAPVRGVDYIADSEDEEEGPLVSVHDLPRLASVSAANIQDEFPCGRLLAQAKLRSLPVSLR